MGNPETEIVLRGPSPAEDIEGECGGIVHRMNGAAIPVLAGHRGHLAGIGEEYLSDHDFEERILPKVKSDPEYQKLFDGDPSNVEFSEPIEQKNAQGETELIYCKMVRTVRLTRAAAAISPETAHLMISQIALTSGLNGNDAFHLAVRWHRMRVAADRVDEWVKGGNDAFEYDPTKDESFESYLEDETPTVEQFKTIFAGTLKARVAVEAAKELALPGFPAGGELQRISAALGVTVRRFIQYGADRPQFALELHGDGIPAVVVIGGGAAVLNQNKFREKLFSAGVFVEQQTAKDWSGICRALLRVRQLAANPTEQREHNFETFEQYATQQVNREERALAIRDGRSFGDGKLVFFRAESVTPEELRALKAAGARQATKSYRVNGVTTSRSYYVVEKRSIRPGVNLVAL